MALGNTVEPLYKGQVRGGSFVPWREVVLSSEVANVLLLWELGPLFRGCPLFREFTIGVSLPVHIDTLYSYS